MGTLTAMRALRATTTLLVAVLLGFLASHGATAQANYSTGFGELDVEGDGTWGGTVIFHGDGYAGGDAVKFYVRHSESGDYVVNGEDHVTDPSGGISIELLVPGDYALGAYSVVVTGKTIDDNDLQLTGAFNVTTSPTTTAAPVSSTAATTPGSSTSSPPSTVGSQTSSSSPTSAPTSSAPTSTPSQPGDTEPTATSQADAGGDDLDALVDYASNQGGSETETTVETAQTAAPGDAGGADSSGFIVWMVFAGLLVLLAGGYWRVRRGSWIG